MTRTGIGKLLLEKLNNYLTNLVIWIMTRTGMGKLLLRTIFTSETFFCLKEALTENPPPPKKTNPRPHLVRWRSPPCLRAWCCWASCSSSAPTWNQTINLVFDQLSFGWGWMVNSCSNCFSEGKLFVEDKTMNLNSFQLLKLKCAEIWCSNISPQILHRVHHFSKTHPPPKPGKFRLSFAQLDGHLMIIIKN